MVDFSFDRQAIHEDQAMSKYSISPLELKAAASKLPPSPQIFGKLSKMLKDRNTGMEDIVELVNTDTSLTAKVLKISNSSSYNMGEPIDSLEQAIGRIGFAELFKVVGMAAASNAFARKNRTYDINGWLYWENSVTIGLAMEHLAPIAGEDPKEAYTLGLLKSMGKTIIDTSAKKFIVPPIYDSSSKTPLLDWEMESLGVTNPEAATIVLESWNFPESAIDALKFQYTPDLAPSENRLARLLNIASGIAEHLGKGAPGESAYWNLSNDCLAEVDLSVSDVREAYKSAKQKVELLTEELAA